MSNAKLTIEFADPYGLDKPEKQNSNELILKTVPKPIKQVNYTIQKLSNFPDQEYISLEIWTDGSIEPNMALKYVLEKLTKLFFNFANLTNDMDLVLLNESD